MAKAVHKCDTLLDMLYGKLLHPDILKALAGAGHGSKVLIADGNYPFSSKANDAATRVYLNLAPGKCTVTEVLEVLVTAVPIESADVMMPEGDVEPSIFQEFRKHLPQDVELQKHGRFQFYDVAMDRNLCLVIATGEQRIFANLLLTLGVVPPPQ